MKKKPVIAIDISSSRRGGPYISSMNIMKSELKEDFDFRPIIYNVSLGRGVSIQRINNLVKQIKQANPDGIIITGLQLSGFNVTLASMIAGVKCRIVVVRGSSLEAINFKGYKRYIMAILEWLTLKMCTAFYGVSKYASQISATKCFKNKNRGHIYNLPTKYLSNNPISRAEVGYKEEDIIVASSGRIIKEKGFGYLVDAIKQIKDNKIKFLIIGDGEYLEEMKLIFKDDRRVMFTGHTSRVMDYLPMVDIFLLPTLHETLSVSLLEAATFSKPLISCRVGGVPEVIKEGYNGILVSPKDSVALLEAIIELASNSNMRKWMGENSKKYVEEKFNTDKIIGSLKRLLINELQKN